MFAVWVVLGSLPTVTTVSGGYHGSFLGKWWTNTLVVGTTSKEENDEGWF